MSIGELVVSVEKRFKEIMDLYLTRKTDKTYANNVSLMAFVADIQNSQFSHLIFSPDALMNMRRYFEKYPDVYSSITRIYYETMMVFTNKEREAYIAQFAEVYGRGIGHEVEVEAYAVMGKEQFYDVPRKVDIELWLKYNPWLLVIMLLNTIGISPESFDLVLSKEDSRPPFSRYGRTIQDIDDE